MAGEQEEDRQRQQGPECRIAGEHGHRVGPRPEAAPTVEPQPSAQGVERVAGGIGGSGLHLGVVVRDQVAAAQFAGREAVLQGGQVEEGGAEQEEGEGDAGRTVECEHRAGKRKGWAILQGRAGCGILVGVGRVAQSARARRSHRRGQGFEPLLAHQDRSHSRCGLFCTRIGADERGCLGIALLRSQCRGGTASLSDPRSSASIRVPSPARKGKRAGRRRRPFWGFPGWGEIRR